jgi:hypothetical protein
MIFFILDLPSENPSPRIKRAMRQARNRKTVRPGPAANRFLLHGTVPTRHASLIEAARTCQLGISTCAGIQQWTPRSIACIFYNYLTSSLICMNNRVRWGAPESRGRSAEQRG